MKNRKTSLDVEEELHFHIEMLRKSRNSQKTVRDHKKTKQLSSTCPQDLINLYCSRWSRNTHPQFRLQGRAYWQRVNHDRHCGPLVALCARLNPSRPRLREA